MTLKGQIAILYDKIEGNLHNFKLGLVLEIFIDTPNLRYMRHPCIGAYKQCRFEEKWSNHFFTTVTDTGDFVPLIVQKLNFLGNSQR